MTLYWSISNVIDPAAKTRDRKPAQWNVSVLRLGKCLTMCVNIYIAYQAESHFIPLTREGRQQKYAYWYEVLWIERYAMDKKRELFQIKSFQNKICIYSIHTTNFLTDYIQSA